MGREEVARVVGGSLGPAGKEFESNIEMVEVLLMGR